MNKSLFLFVIIGVSLFFSVSVRADSDWSLRCGVDLIRPGESQLKVLDQCGQPDSKTAYPTYGRHGEMDPSVEVWKYNFGPTDFIYNLVFADGRLDEIHQMGRGF